MKRIYLITVLVLIANINLLSQSESQIIVPTFNDKYSKYVAQLESGQTDIDYKDFRYSFLESKQFITANDKSLEFDKLKKEMYAQMDKSNYQKIIKITKQILSIDYTCMLAHKILRQTYKIVGDTINETKYKTIQFGLLNSIVKNGDGKTCQTAWPVIQLDEEYFILSMLGAELKEQAHVTGKGNCDRMIVDEDGKENTYYFEISKIFEGYTKLGL